MMGGGCHHEIATSTVSQAHRQNTERAAKCCWARAARKKHALKVRLVATFTPTGGTAKSVSKTLLLKKTGYRPEPVTG